VQSYIGHHVDESHHKRLIAASAAITVTLGCLGIVLLPSFWMQGVVQAVIGIAVTVFPAATAAFALGLVDKQDLSKRIGRNETFTHAGNVVFAVLAAVVGQLLAIGGIFFAAGIFASGMAGASYWIRGDDVNYDAARESEGEGQRKRARDLFGDKRIITFTLAVVLFNAGNSATLPLVGQLLSSGKKGAAVWQISACVIVAEIVMVGVAAFIGKRVDGWGRKPLFLVG